MMMACAMMGHGMGMGMGGGWHSILHIKLAGLLVLGFAYILYLFANKEQGIVKLIGQILTGLIVIVTVVAIVASLFWSGMLPGKKGEMWDKDTMMKHKMMMKQKMMDMDH